MQSMEDLVREFLLESHEGLDRMEQCLGQMAQASVGSEPLREIFRSVHTIKGATGFLGFERLERVAHAGENLLVKMRDGELSPTPARIDVLLLLLDALRGILQGIEQGDGIEPAGEDVHLLEQLAAQQTDATPVATAPVVEDVGAYPAAPPILAAQPMEVANPSAAPAAPIPVSKEPTEVLVAANDVTDSTVRVDVEVLQQLLNLAGELVLTRNQIVAAAHGSTMETLAQRLHRVTGEIREAVMRVRMQPVEQVFARFPRLVRELSRQCGKSVRLEMEGQQTLLDRSVLEMIRDPLLHAIRNAIDHGIETAEVRASRGKPQEGLLRLRATSAGDHVLIEVSDDGGGMVPERLRQSAVNKGLLTPEQAAALSDAEARNLVFLPGFSTAAQVTNVSGRGVGLDVVRQNVERLGGSVGLASSEGVGTTIRLRLPLTLAILPALIVRCGNQRFAVAQKSVEELLHRSAVDCGKDIECMGALQLLRLRDRLLALTDLRVLLRLPKHKDAAAKDNAGENFAVLKAEGLRFALRVDALEGVEELVVRPLDRIAEADVFSGAAQLADGGLVLVLDVAGLASLAGVVDAQIQEESIVDMQTTAQQQYLHVALRGIPAVIPIEHVEHVMAVQATSIVPMGGVLVLQDGDEVLPLLDGVRSGRGEGVEVLQLAAEAPAPTWNVLLCTSDVGRMGLLVSAVHGMVQTEPFTVRNVEHPEEPEQSVVRLPDGLARVICPANWREFVQHPEAWQPLNLLQWQNTNTEQAGREVQS